jgi:acid phosphatase
MLGYGQPLSPYLGMPWVKTAVHLLDGQDTEDDDHPKMLSAFGKDDHPDLPKPKLPPNATHTQL